MRKKVSISSKFNHLFVESRKLKVRYTNIGTYNLWFIFFNSCFTCIVFLEPRDSLVEYSFMGTVCRFTSLNCYYEQNKLAMTLMMICYTCIVSSRYSSNDIVLLYVFLCIRKNNQVRSCLII